MKIKFKNRSGHGPAMTKAIYIVMECIGWGLCDARDAWENGEVNYLDQRTAEALKIKLEDAGAESIKILEEQ